MIPGPLTHPHITQEEHFALQRHTSPNWGGSLMATFYVDSDLHQSPEVSSIPRKHRAAALGLWTLAGSWSAEQVTGGFIPTEALTELGGGSGARLLANYLVSAGLWTTVKDGWRFTPRYWKHV